MPTYPPNATFTSRLKLPRPGLDDVADGPDAFNDLTDILDPLIAAYASGTTATRPATPPAGSFYWNTDTKTLEFYNGTAWAAASGTTAISSPVGDVGMVAQCRAGRQLAVSDFTTLGLAQPRGLWNLADLTNLGSDGRALANKGAVTFAPGVNGAASTAAQFTGSTSQALYIPDTGAADSFRISTGSWGCWFRTAKRGTTQGVIGKRGAAAGQYAWMLAVEASNIVQVVASVDGASLGIANCVSDVADDRWHFAVATHDGTQLRAYVDGVLETTTALTGALFASSGPVNVGAFAADSGAAALAPHYGRVDEAFVSADVLSEDQVRCLYAAKLTHTLGVVPTGVRLNVRRNRKGAALAVGDFTAQPLRLHNFTAGSLNDQGSNATPFGGVTGVNAIVPVAGADGSLGNGYSFSGSHNGLPATDAGLPAALTARSYGCWFKTTAQNSYPTLIGWGGSTNAARIAVGAGTIAAMSGADIITSGYVADGQWHFVVLVEDNTAADGVKRKLYLDGRLVGGSTVLNTLAPGGANAFRVGAAMNGTDTFVGQIDGVFVAGYAMTTDEVMRLYAKGSQALAPSPKNAGDHVEALQSDGVLFIGDTLESQHTIDVGVTV
jgi:hypothetical protein